MTIKTKAEASKGQAQPFTADDIAKIRRMIGKAGDLRDAALFEVAISTALRTSDLLALTLADVLGTDGTLARQFTVRQGKTRRAVAVTLTEPARAALQAWIAAGNLTGSDPLWLRLDRAASGRREAISGKTYRTTVKQWAGYADRKADRFSGHSTRRTLASHVYAMTKDIEVCRKLLGHGSVANTSVYLAVSDRDVAATVEAFAL